MLIRPENESDKDAVYAVNISAFKTSAEARLADDLRERAQPHVSLVAVENRRIVGHIMFSPVYLPRHPDVKLMGLAPMSVEPEFQRRGIGSALIKTGLKHCRQLGIDAVVVLGHPEYYPRFGFFPSSRFGIDCEYEVPEEVFMTMELNPGSLTGISGTVIYHSAFSNL